MYGSSKDNLFLVKVPVLVATISLASRCEEVLALAGNTTYHERRTLHERLKEEFNCFNEKKGTYLSVQSISTPANDSMADNF